MKSTTQTIYTTLVCAVIVMIGLAHGRPQQFSRPEGNQARPGNGNGNQWNPQNPFFPGRPRQPNDDTVTTTPIPPTATTASPAYLNCLQTCPATTEYNPICGSDGINYQNNNRLRCAVYCGRSVTAIRQGTCSPL